MNLETDCRTDEALEDLQRNGLRILQKRDGYRFGMDAVLLAHFAALRPRTRVADLGTGSGVLPLLMSQFEPSVHFFAFELQPEIADMARRSIAINGLSDRIEVVCDDLRNAPATLGLGSMNAIVCNPPYGQNGAGTPSQGISRQLAMQETNCTLADIIASSASLLQNHGKLWICLPARRALELMDTLRTHRLEPKRIQMVCARTNKPPYLMLVEAVKNAKPSLLWLPSLIANGEDGKMTDELRALYNGRV